MVNTKFAEIKTREINFVFDGMEHAQTREILVRRVFAECAKFAVL